MKDLLIVCVVFCGGLRNFNYFIIVCNNLLDALSRLVNIDMISVLERKSKSIKFYLACSPDNPRRVLGFDHRSHWIQLDFIVDELYGQDLFSLKQNEGVRAQSRMEPHEFLAWFILHDSYVLLFDWISRLSSNYLAEHKISHRADEEN